MWGLRKKDCLGYNKYVCRVTSISVNEYVEYDICHVTVSLWTQCFSPGLKFCVCLMKGMLCKWREWKQPTNLSVCPSLVVHPQQCFSTCFTFSVICFLQAWSITYVSWLTFVFLIWSCMLWMVRDRRRYAMLSSPFMVAYGNLLIVLQYIYSFENLDPVPGFFVKKKNPFHSLSSKVWKLKIFFFWFWNCYVFLSTMIF